MSANLNLSKSNINRLAPVLSDMNVSFISVTPNPTAGSMVVNNAKFIAGSTYPLDIFNAAGVSVFQKTMTAQQETISLSAPDGTYYLNLNTQDGLAAKQITKQSR